MLFLLFMNLLSRKPDKDTGLGEVIGVFVYAFVIAFFLSWWLETRGIVSPNPPRAEPRRSSPSACQLAGDCEFIEPDSYQFEENVWGE